METVTVLINSAIPVIEIHEGTNTIEVKQAAPATIEMTLATPGPKGADFVYEDFTEEQLLALVGPQGEAGPQGPQGIKGADGATGLKGDVGETGPQGPVGPQGVQGIAGSQGEIGPQGAQGPKGDTGSTGAQGPQGERGLQGIQGETGPQGAKGDTGLKGDTGSQGVKGDTGSQGAQGVQGVPGNDGAPGTTDYNALSNKPAAGQAIVNFGTILQEDSIAKTTVPMASVLSSSVIMISPAGVATTDHDIDDYQWDDISGYAANIVDGVSFDIVGVAPNGSWGQYKFNYVIN